jgi:hypothetical protein
MFVWSSSASPVSEANLRNAVNHAASTDFAAAPPAAATPRDGATPRGKTDKRGSSVQIKVASICVSNHVCAHVLQV